MKTSGPEGLVSGLEMAGIGLWKWEPATDVVSVDALAREMCGLGEAECLTLAMLSEGLPAEDFRRFEAALHRQLLGAESSEVSVECRLSVKGTERWLAFSTGTWRESAVSGRGCGCLVGVVRDITDLKQRERSLARERRDLEQRLEAQHELVTSTRHDLRNALASLQSAVHLFNRAELHPDVRAATCVGLQVQIDRIVLITNQLMQAGLDSDQSPPRSATAATTAGPYLSGTTLEPHPQRIQRPRRVLVADDNTDAATTLATLLRMEGHDVVIAHDGRQAVELAEKSHPEVLLLDLAMPEKDGLSVAREIKQQSWARDCTLIAISGCDRSEDRQRTSDAGFTKHLAKPLDFDELSRLLAG
jgi:PAS domain S-box-containing protein